MKEIAGAYEPKTVENKIYRQWLASGFFTPEKLPAALIGGLGKRSKKFVVMISPPNITPSPPPFSLFFKNSFALAF